ncbi:MULTISPECIES: hypothetical protein [Lactiplantibacillus]|uniref:Uncharacterized protein n=1 Tax=Lactiplantibacillus pentosus TaxID=1589 RepID=A0AAW8WG50_LACPE|nr:MULTISPECIES: hypothetical protein [Lactiplantibacillus]MBU7459665.1 hypothetical protein [Lactiplantibacillus pentosus]MBU7463059.1 hypothetical protein [Lactiplantibacillus pentosus]MBU7473930.1 hypothetical protein [Lactiplantibacillus pentosus]MBU7476405.1 hypothetical protein [Lactiplantibacillus pentosus]MBU7482367.1 hypothetical protein [Lactiplantibacillus sp. 30.2.29]
MADEQPPIWVQLVTVCLVTGTSGKALIGIVDALWHLSTEKIPGILFINLNTTNFNGN